MTATLQIKSRYGNYSTVTREFANEKHLDNYINKVYDHGSDLIGLTVH